MFLQLMDEAKPAEQPGSSGAPAAGAASAPVKPEAPAAAAPVSAISAAAPIPAEEPKPGEKAPEKPAAPVPPALDDVKKYLTEKGSKADDLAKLDEAGLRKKYDELKAAEKPGEKKPVEYQAFKLPEGVVADEKMLTDFKTIAAEAGLSQEAAQKFVDLYGAQLAELSQQPFKQWMQLQQKWQGELANDAEIGGAALKENLGIIASAIDIVGGKDAAAIRQALDMTGAGNNPVLTKFIWRMAVALGEGAPVDGNKAVQLNRKNPAEVLYPDQGQVAQGNAQ